VDRLTKIVLFFPIKMTNSVDKLARMYVNEVVKLHDVLVSIVSDRDLDLHHDCGQVSNVL